MSEKTENVNVGFAVHWIPEGPLQRIIAGHYVGGVSEMLRQGTSGHADVCGQPEETASDAPKYPAPLTFPLRASQPARNSEVANVPPGIN